MENTLLISIIVPVYNRAHLVPVAIQSVLNQTEINWELIIVDDCSTDNIMGVISEYKDERIKFHKLPVNKGNAGARNEGVKKAAGDYIFFLDSDDEMYPGAFKCFLEEYEKNLKIDFAFGGYRVHNNAKDTSEDIFWIPKENIPFIRELKIGTGCGLFVKRSLFKEVGLFDEDLRVAVDTDWLIRLDNCGYKPTLLNSLIVVVNIHKGERVRKDRSQLLKSYEIILKKNFDLINKDKSLLKKFYYKLQWLNYHQGNISQGNSSFYKLLKYRILLKNSIVLYFLFNFSKKEFAKRTHVNMSGERI